MGRVSENRENSENSNGKKKVNKYPLFRHTPLILNKNSKIIFDSCIRGNVLSHNFFSNYYPKIANSSFRL